MQAALPRRLPPHLLLHLPPLHQVLETPRTQTTSLKRLIRISIVPPVIVVKIKEGEEEKIEEGGRKRRVQQLQDRINEDRELEKERRKIEKEVKYYKDWKEESEIYGQYYEEEVVKRNFVRQTLFLGFYGASLFIVDKHEMD